MSDNRFTVHYQCPWCGLEGTSVGHLSGVDPSPGNVGINICWQCKKPSLGYVTGEGTMVLSKPSSEGMEKILQRPDVKRAMAAIGESYSADQVLDLIHGRG